MQTSLKERILDVLERAKAGAEQNVWPRQNAPQHVRYLESMIEEVSQLEELLEYKDELFSDWHRRALEIANLCARIAKDSSTVYDAVTSVSERVIGCQGYYTASGCSERGWTEFPSAYMLFNDDEIVVEENLRLEGERRKAAEKEAEHKKILAEEAERQERETLKKLMDKYKPFAQG